MRWRTLGWVSAVGRARWVVVACVLPLAGALACASGPAGVTDALRRGRLRDALAAYERGRPDLPALQRIAAVALEHEAQSDDKQQRAQALAALELSNPWSERALERLALRAPNPTTRSKALALLARLGDASARLELLGKLGDADAEVRAVAIEALDPERDAALLRRLCDVPESAVRLAAVRELGRAKENQESSLLLARVARLDPSLPVRVAALDALGAQGPKAAEAIEERLDDSEPALRAAAVNALVRADYARAAQRLERYLADNPTPVGIEAARALLTADPVHAPPAASSQLERALGQRDNALRAAAAVALMSLRDARLGQMAAERAKHEAVRSVRLSLALALGTGQADARALLAELSAQRDVVSTQASAELARRGDARALQRLLEQAKSRDVAVRRIAVRALAQELGHAHDVRSALLDRDASVRIAAAGAILAARA